MMSEIAAKYHALYLTNAALADEMERQFPSHRGWSGVVRFYAALHLMNAYLIGKPRIRFDPDSTDHQARTHAMALCPELRDAPVNYRILKNLSEAVRYDVNYEYADVGRNDAVAWLARIAAIVEPKLKKR